MTIDEINEQLAICLAATPGPLRACIVPDKSGRHHFEVRRDDNCEVANCNPFLGCHGAYNGEQCEANAEFFVAARTGWPEALKELAEAKTELVNLRRMAALYRALVEER